MRLKIRLKNGSNFDMFKKGLSRCGHIVWAHAQSWAHVGHIDKKPLENIAFLSAQGWAGLKRVYTKQRITSLYNGHLILGTWKLPSKNYQIKHLKYHYEK